MQKFSLGNLLPASKLHPEMVAQAMQRFKKHRWEAVCTFQCRSMIFSGKDSKRVPEGIWNDYAYASFEKFSWVVCTEVTSSFLLIKLLPLRGKRMCLSIGGGLHLSQHGRTCFFFCTMAVLEASVFCFGISKVLSSKLSKQQHLKLFFPSCIYQWWHGIRADRCYFRQGIVHAAYEGTCLGSTQYYFRKDGKGADMHTFSN